MLKAIEGIPNEGTVILKKKYFFGFPQGLRDMKDRGDKTSDTSHGKDKDTSDKVGY